MASPAKLNSREALALKDVPDADVRPGKLKDLSDRALLSGLERLCGTERAVQLGIMYYLIEVERRRVYLPLGYGSLFDFCTGRLKYSKSAAGRRINAARCIDRFPRVGELFVSGRLSLTVVSMISGIMTDENAQEILSHALGRYSRDIEMLVARYRPSAVLRDRVRPVCIMTESTLAPESNRNAAAPAPAAFAPISAQPTEGSCGCANASHHECIANSTPGAGSAKFPNREGESNGSPPAMPNGEAIERVLLTRKYELRFGVDPEFMAKLERVRSMLSGKCGKRLSFEELFGVLIDYYLDRESPEGRMDRKKKREERGMSGKPAARLKRRERSCDAGRADESPESGANAADNLRLLCARHNRLQAERAYGIDFMNRHR